MTIIDVITPDKAIIYLDISELKDSKNEIINKLKQQMGVFFKKTLVIFHNGEITAHYDIKEGAIKTSLDITGKTFEKVGLELLKIKEFLNA